MKPMEFKVYLQEPQLCVVENLREYIKKEAPSRKNYELFLSYHKPYAPVSKDTMWKEIIQMAVINIKEHCCHSPRSAACSYAHLKRVSMKNTCHSAGWSSDRTFALFCKKGFGV